MLRKGFILVCLMLITGSAFSGEKVGASKCMDQMSNQEFEDFFARYGLYADCVDIKTRTRYMLGNGDYKEAIKNSKIHCSDVYDYAKEYLTDIALCSDVDAFFLIYSIDRQSSEKQKKDVLNFFVINDDDESSNFERICAEEGNKDEQQKGLHIKTIINYNFCLAVHGALKILSGKTNDRNAAIGDSVEECGEEFELVKAGLFTAGCSKNRSQELALETFTLFLPITKERMQSYLQ